MLKTALLPTIIVPKLTSARRNDSYGVSVILFLKRANIKEFFRLCGRKRLLLGGGRFESYFLLIASRRKCLKEFLRYSRNKVSSER